MKDQEHDIKQVVLQTNEWEIATLQKHDHTLCPESTAGKSAMDRSTVNDIDDF